MSIYCDCERVRDLGEKKVQLGKDFKCKRPKLELKMEDYDKQ